MWELFDYFSTGNENEIASWTRGLEKRQRIKLRSKLDDLIRYGPDLPPQLLAGTGVPHIYKLKVKGNVQLRPMLCKGPIDNDGEFTLLIGAIEADYELHPADAIARAVARRLEIISDPARRCKHERI